MSEGLTKAEALAYWQDLADERGEALAAAEARAEALLTDRREWRARAEKAEAERDALTDAANKARYAEMDWQEIAGKLAEGLRVYNRTSTLDPGLRRSMAQKRAHALAAYDAMERGEETVPDNHPFWYRGR